MAPAQAESPQILKPERRVGFVPEPNCGRGTIGLLWKCLPTTFLCIYTILHYNTPRRRLTGFRRFKQDAIWVSIGLLFPEFMCLRAIAEYLYARRLQQSAKMAVSSSISMTQAFCLVSGSLRIRGLKQSYLLDLLAWPALALDGVKSTWEDHWWYILNKVPTDSQIMDRSKSDSLGKILTSFQATWVSLSVIGRLVAGQTLSLVEAATMAYVLLGLVTFITWFRKPYRCIDAIELEPLNSLQSSWFQADSVSPTLLEWTDLESIEIILKTLSPPERTGHFGTWFIRAIPVGIVSLGFAAIHMAAWNYGFATSTEALLWRISAVGLGVVPSIWLLCVAILDPTDDKEFEFVEYVLVLLPPFAYVVARLYIITEIFLSLRAAPAGVYTTVTWPQLIGHIGS